MTEKKMRQREEESSNRENREPQTGGIESPQIQEAEPLKQRLPKK